MTYVIGGYKPSTGPLNVQPFGSSNTLRQLASLNTTDTYIIPNNSVPFDDQGTLNSCVANASTTAFEILRGLSDPNSVKMLSRLFVYWNARMYTQDTDKDQGTYIHNAMDSLTKLGVCEESIWPYDTTKVFAQPPIIAYKEGNDNMINNYYQITTNGQDRLNDIELAIRANHPVVFGTGVGTEFESYTGGPQVFGPPSKILGGHALVVVGVRRNPDIQFCIRNSWGPLWGDSGFIWFSANYMTWDETNDLFVATNMDNLLV